MKPQISVLIKLSFNISFIAPGSRPQTPVDAPPLAGFNMKSPVAYNHIIPYLHDMIKIVFTRTRIYGLAF
jgi:hypothetical protein